MLETDRFKNEGKKLLVPAGTFISKQSPKRHCCVCLALRLHFDANAVAGERHMWFQAAYGISYAGRLVKEARPQPELLGFIDWVQVLGANNVKGFDKCRQRVVSCND